MYKIIIIKDGREIVSLSSPGHNLEETAKQAVRSVRLSENKPLLLEKSKRGVNDG
jgi:hypothetical protein